MEPLQEYVSIVHNRQRNPLPEGQYGEVHHIIPKSCGGPLKADWNLVRLTPEEHYRCHYLLTFIYAEGKAHGKMVSAWWLLAHTREGLEISEEEYGRFKREYSELHKGKHPSKETRRKLSEAHKGRCFSNETRRKLSEAAKGNKRGLGHHLSEEAKRKISEAHKGKPKSAEAIRKSAEAHKGKTTWNKGKSWSEETKRKISEAKQNLSNETRHRLSESLKRYWASKRNLGVA